MQSERALLALEEKLEVDLPIEWEELSKRGHLYDQSRIMFRRPWPAEIIDREMALLYHNYVDLVEGTQSPDSSCDTGSWNDLDVFAWRGAVVELMSRLSTLIPKPSRRLVQQGDSK